MTIEKLTTLAFSMYSNKGAYALLLGSGISRSAHIPTGWEVETALIEQLAASKKDIIKDNPHQWFKERYEKEASYSFLLEELVKTPTERVQLMKQFFEPTEEEKELVRGFSLLSMKPMIYAANVEEDALSGVENNALVAQVRQAAQKEGAEVVVVSAKVEEELAQLEEEERTMFLNELGLESAGLDRLVEASYRLLGLISYLTAGPKEVRAWTIEKGTKAPQAAGKIHSDFEKGFIRAEIVTYEDLVACGSIAAAREKGLYRSEGKEYVIQDGDVVLFRFNV